MENKKLLEEIYRLMNEQYFIPNMEKRESLTAWVYVFSQLGLMISKDKEFKTKEITRP